MKNDPAQRFATWIKSWNLPAWLAAALCASAFVIMVIASAGATEEGAVEPGAQIWELIIAVLMVVPVAVLLLPFVATTPWISFMLIRRTADRGLQAVLLIISFISLVFYYRMLAPANLTANSTAALAVYFIPLNIALFTLPVSLALFHISRRRRGIERGVSEFHQHDPE